MVDKHIEGLRRQLADKGKSVISLIQTWNTFEATFTSNFGKPANCFGRAHVDQILAAHRHIQRKIFASPSPILAARFGVRDIPDAYLFFPVELGGLDLRSPFISVLPVRESVPSATDKILERFLEAEREDYKQKKRAYENGSSVPNPYPYPYPNINPNPNRGGGGAPKTAMATTRTRTRKTTGGYNAARDRKEFMSFDEYVRYREDLYYDFLDNLGVVYGKLLDVPVETSDFGIGEASASIHAAVEALASSENKSVGVRLAKALRANGHP